MDLVSLPALTSNYIWILRQQNSFVIVDPGDAKPVLEYIKNNPTFQPVAILLTHHHDDHTAGIPELLKHYPFLPIYGPKETLSKGTNHLVDDVKSLQIGPFCFNVISVPGHTLGHVAYYLTPYLFCGDTLFSAGCGRVFEGTIEQMFDSLNKLSVLPDQTLVCCGHEYTFNNLSFSRFLFPNDELIEKYSVKIQRLVQKKQKTLPSSLFDERKMNIFLRCSEESLKNQLDGHVSKIDDIEFFALLRQKKDNW